MYGELGKRRNLGHFMLALDVARFTGAAAFRAQIDAFVREIRSQEPSDPKRPPLAPGDPERACALARAKQGVPVGDGVLAELNALAASLGVPGL
jgi:LDH2 family malate/lactate/ureidoglycolate dehydrogenase